MAKIGHPWLRVWHSAGLSIGEGSFTQNASCVMALGPPCDSYTTSAVSVRPAATHFLTFLQNIVVNKRVKVNRIGTEIKLCFLKFE